MSNDRLELITALIDTAEKAKVGKLVNAILVAEDASGKYLWHIHGNPVMLAGYASILALATRENGKTALMQLPKE